VRKYLKYEINVFVKEKLASAPEGTAQKCLLGRAST
jgi:hypothetical protein